MIAPSLSAFFGRLRHAAAAAILLPFLASTAALADKEPNEIRIDGVIGADNRELVNSLNPPWNAVGKINIKGYRKKQHCTATLIAPNKVITAAHCLQDNKNGVPVQTDRIHFLAGVQRGEFLEHATAACVHFLNPYGTPHSIGDDVAIIVLAKELSIPPVTVPDINTVPGSSRLVHAGYTRDRPHSLAADSTCQLKARQEKLWFTDCDTNFGASGGPVFVKRDGQLALAAIMVGYTKDKHSIAVPSTAWNFPREQQACD